MANLIDAYRSHQNVNNPSPVYKHAYTVNTQGKVKPLEDKGRLLPSRIFGSPVEYVKDLKKDIVNIGRAANGKANDHELGRINDVAMKLGSLALATYLFIKNPLKLSKTMEFVGFGTFFGAMALWPKLAIQAPIKARTGVDVHQKYIDSQDRKKMLFQDPQYDLTDLYSREDLDKMGKKLKVAKNLPDRDRFIKQRAKKTAVQANTLWMLTAGFASPVMSALACNALETPIDEAFERSALKKTEQALKSGKVSGFIKNLSSSNTDVLQKFLEQNAGKEVTEEMIDKIVYELLPDVNSADLTMSIKKSIQDLVRRSNNNSSAMSFEFVSNALKDILPENFMASLQLKEKEALNDAITKGSVSDIANIIGNLLEKSGQLPVRQKAKKLQQITGKLASETQAASPVTLDKISSQITKLGDSLKEFVSGRKLVDDFINARVGDKSGTYIANHWNRVCKKLFKKLKFSQKDLLELQKGNMDIFIEKLTALSKAEGKDGVESLLNELLTLMNDYEEKAGNKLVEGVENNFRRICENTAASLSEGNYKSLSDKIFKKYTEASIEEVASNVEEICTKIGMHKDEIDALSKSFKSKLKAEDIKGAIELLKNNSTLMDEKFKDQIDYNKIQELYNKLMAVKRDTVENTVNQMAAERALGAKSSLYRLIQSIDILNPNNKSLLEDRIKTSYKKIKNTDADDKVVASLYETIKKVLLEATPTDYVEKFMTSKINMDADEYRIISDVLFDKADDVILLTKPSGGKEALKSFNAYIKDFRLKVWNWVNDMTPDLKDRVSKELTKDMKDVATKDVPKTYGANAVERSNFIGKSVKDYMQESASKIYNSKKWLKIFGTSMAVLVGVTLVAGLFFGRKSKIEKELEENKQNG